MLRKPLLAFLLLSLSACSSMVSERFANNLGDAILTQNDPDIAAASMPTFLVMMDSLVLGAPENATILSASADLNGAYATLFVSDASRARQLTDKSLRQARTALCTVENGICASENADLDTFRQALKQLRRDDIALLYSYGTAWAGWIQTHRNDWNGLAQVPKVEAVMTRVAELNEQYQWGRAHLYLAVINSQIPPALGGKPETGRLHFEKAIAISQGKDLVAKVEYARHYARLMFDQELHDRLLNEVITAQPGVAKLNLSNALAKQAARELLDTSEEYFEE
ncbi:hypothetical protein Tel_07785 [Candidatus Tenderia electrophaga]|jgi:hypothetical protein|uniref:TRAP transporter TatT component family protein n=1 Tax=Candidatus Tenderia electrophaga TaxID=1748243 RepID=A0A0S2TD18_9GAMM|nr:hypothetical protein Tel_07785 [Candidatus Tenderia electrophaga]